MAIICPTVTAFDDLAYNEQVRQLKPFAQRVHIDAMDGEFTPTKSPDLERTWWPHELQADIHLMYKWPMHVLEQVARLQPHMVIIHAEAQLDHMHFAARLHRYGIETGLAVMQDTPIESVEPIMHSFDQILIFSGSLGRHGGTADLQLLDKVRFVRELHPDAEIAWDGGINVANAPKLVASGVDVLNVGGFIANAEDPAAAYAALAAVLESDANTTA